MTVEIVVLHASGHNSQIETLSKITQCPFYGVPQRTEVAGKLLFHSSVLIVDHQVDEASATEVALVKLRGIASQLRALDAYLSVEFQSSISSNDGSVALSISAGHVSEFAKFRCNLIHQCYQQI
jgi:hypothetical protein